MLRELLNRAAGNPRAGKRYREVERNGQMVHDYAEGPDVAVGPAARESGMTPPAPAQGEFHGATSLADMLRGAGLHRMQHRGENPSVDRINMESPAIQGGGDVAGGMLHTNTQEGNPRQGQLAQSIQIGGRKFHIYFSPDGQKQVIELKPHPQAE